MYARNLWLSTTIGVKRPKLVRFISPQLPSLLDDFHIPALQSIVEALTHVNTEQRTWVFHSMLQDETHPFMSYIGTGVQPHISQFIESFTKTPCPAMHRCLTCVFSAHSRCIINK